MEEYRVFAEGLVKEAGGRLKAASLTAFETTHKGADERDVVTSVDRELNTWLVDSIKKTYPEHSVSSEEGGGAAGTSEWKWVLDPIDGSANFSRGIPHFAVSVGLLKNDEPVAGAVYNPMTDELFSFEKGRGAFLNDKSIHVSDITELGGAQGILVVGHRAPLWDWGGAVYREFIEHLKKLKALGSSSLDLCFLAAGRADLVVYGTLTTCDAAAAIGTVRAAGGEVYNLVSGEPISLTPERQTIVATANLELFEKMKPLLHTDLLPKG